MSESEFSGWKNSQNLIADQLPHSVNSLILKILIQTLIGDKMATISLLAVVPTWRHKPRWRLIIQYEYRVQ